MLEIFHCHFWNQGIWISDYQLFLSMLSKKKLKVVVLCYFTNFYLISAARCNRNLRLPLYRMVPLVSWSRIWNGLAVAVWFVYGFCMTYPLVDFVLFTSDSPWLTDGFSLFLLSVPVFFPALPLPPKQYWQLFK